MSKYIGTPVVNISADTVDVTGDITTTDATPEVIIVNDTHEDTDGGREGKVTFKGQQSGGEETTLAQIQASHDGTSDDEKGDLIFKTNDGSDGASPTEAMRIDSEQNLGLGTNSPDVRLHVTDTQEQLTLSEGGSKGATFDYRSSTGFLQIATNGIDARANPQITLDLNGQLRVGRADDAVMNNALTVDSGNNYQVLGLERSSGVSTGTGEFAIHMETNSQTTISYDDEGSVVFGTAGTPSTAAGFSEKVRIDATGNFLVGRNAAFTSGGGNTGGAGAVMIARDNERCLFLLRASGDGEVVNFIRGGTTSPVGTISITSSATSYNTSSDHRLKENVETLSDGITRVKQLKPKRFSWIVDERDDANVDGFLAHEAQTVVPEAVTGTHNGMKDEEYIVSAATGDIYTPATVEAEEVIHSSNVEEPETLEEGQKWRETTAAEMGTQTVPDMQGIDQAKIVPLLTAALKEAIAKIETLETKVAALEGE